MEDSPIIRQPLLANVEEAHISSKWIRHVTEATDRSRRFFLTTQAPEGFWVGELQSNVTIVAEYIMFQNFLGQPSPRRLRKAVRHILRTQLPDGGWSIYYGGPSELSATVEAYFALKMTGRPADDPAMKEASELIRAKGGVEKSRVFTKINLALFGQYSWEGIPSMPVEMMFLPTGFYFNIYEFSSWSRSVIVPLMIIFAQKPQVKLDGFPGIDELYASPADQRAGAVEWSEELVSWRNFFVLADRVLKILERRTIPSVRAAAIRRAEQWILEHQDITGDWGGIMPAMMNSVLALLSLGYRPTDLVIAKGLEAIERFGIETSDEFRLQSCVSPVWDTAITMIALAESGLDPTHHALTKAARWLVGKQVLRKGDWAVKNRKGKPGGWSFEFFNDFFPDNDDTAMVLLALRHVHIPEEQTLKEACQRGLAWLLSMQCDDGGWGAFDMNNNKRLLNRIPFADLESLLDPSTSDVTGRVMELLSKLGYPPQHPVMRRALRFLRKDQTEDGSWYGRWGVNYIYGTWAVLTGLRALGEDCSQGYIQRAIRWLEGCQNPDGGWGESCDTYDHPQSKPKTTSTPSQTAWAVMALIESGKAHSSAVQRGIRFLVERQQADGTWAEEEYTGTGFPKHFYINYHLYRNYFPLMALARYRSAVARRVTG